MTPFYFSEPLVRVALSEDSPFGLYPHGRYNVNASENMITYQPLEEDSHMEVRGIRIGRGFHWDSLCAFTYPGVIQVVKDDGHTLLLNILKAEKYLESVTGSEMHPQAPAEFAKAHTIIARSWLLRQMSKSKAGESRGGEVVPGRVITWTEATAHKGYDVCSDDHCQRYQGLGSVSETSRRAVEQTRGMVLTDGQGDIVDARYSKCCGGATELFSTCWADIDYPYLKRVEDPYCHPARLKAALEKHPTLLKDYDSRTADYYEWRVEVPASLIEKNLSELYDVNIGEVRELEPVNTGTSGRISELLIKGTEGEVVVGKELTIRRLLSDTHLYSSAFTIQRQGSAFILNGRGWGHGVGLCQIGAAVMAVAGLTCEEILAHYYPGTRLTKLYD